MRRLPWIGMVMTAWLAFGCATPAREAPQAAGASAPEPRASPAAAVASTPTPPPSLQPLQVPMAAISGSMTPLWVARDYGLFARHGLEVELTGMSPTQASQALGSGSVPIAALGGSAVSLYASGATDLVFVAGQTNKAVWRVMGQPDVARLDDLRGQRVGSTSPGSGATLALFETFRRFGIEPTRDLEIVYLRELPGVLAGLTSGAVRGGVLSSPFVEQGLAHGLVSLVDMRDLNIASLAINMTTTRTQLARDRDLVRRFVMGYIEGIQYARDHPEQAIDAILRGSRSDNRADAATAYELYRTVWDPWPSEAAIQTVLDNMDPPAPHVQPADMIDLSILRELEQSGWLAQHYRPL